MDSLWRFYRIIKSVLQKRTNAEISVRKANKFEQNNTCYYEGLNLLWFKVDKIVTLKISQTIVLQKKKLRFIMKRKKLF